MESARAPAVKDDDIYVITPRGNRELQSSGTSLSVADLEVLVLVDGFSSVADIARHVPGVTRDEVKAAIQKQLTAKLIASTAEPETDVLGSGFSTIAVPAGFFSGLTLDSSPAADGSASILKKKGYYVRIARRPASPHESQEGWKPTILVIDDDADMQKLVRTYLMMEGFITRAAYKLGDILVALRIAPPPDLILLDVHLPDADGFDLLAKMRQHPALKHMPVIMLTAEATREAVLKGLRGGADGYVTKPFEPDLLVSAVKAVLGLSSAPERKKK